MSLFAKASANLSLTPSERATLKFLESLIVGAFVTAMPVVAQLLSSQLNAGAVDWRQTATFGLAALVFAFLMAVVKWAKAHLDNPLAASVAVVATQIANSVAAAGDLSSEVKSELDPTGQPNTPDSGPLGAAASASA